ncbi:hypothetical protein [Nocardioides alcanivorans]|uniref:hypothetical protein n=1 Tax=Nocardioides alcanivorans TaxID=2897352 RepID=UPI001F23337A|nr:hypothetical protein [Nocardioides alcanivorans]
MRLPLIVYILTALALVVVVLTRVRLRGDAPAAGRLQTSSLLLNVHTIAGLAAVASWTAFLITGIGDDNGDSQIGILALGLFWLTTVAGIMILFRWMPARGKHSQAAVGDSWSTGPGLSVLAHVGMLVGTVLFTWAYMFSKI